MNFQIQFQNCEAKSWNSTCDCKIQNYSWTDTHIFYNNWTKSLFFMKIRILYHFLKQQQQTNSDKMNSESLWVYGKIKMIQ